MPERHQSHTVLVVDDSPLIRSVIKEAVDLAGLDIAAVLEAGNGREALAVLRARPIDVVVTNLHMLELDGRQLIEEMGRDPMLERTPVVVVSSSQYEARLEELNVGSIRAKVLRPFRPERVKAVMLELLRPRCEDASG
jgi:two-component system, chemotaxis family, chemotaxis protein CheY